MPSINMQQFNKILKAYKKTEKEYEKLSDIFESKSYNDLVDFEGYISDLKGNIEKSIELRAEIKGMLGILKLNTEEDEKKYEEMLNHLDREIPRRKKEHNYYIDDLNKTTVRGYGYEHRKL